MFQYIKLVLGKDPLNPSTLFNPFKREYKRLSIWKVFFNNLKYEIFWRHWWHRPNESAIQQLKQIRKLEQRIAELEENIKNNSKWIRD